MIRNITALIISVSVCGFHSLFATEYINNFDSPECIRQTAFSNFQKGKCKSSIVQQDGHKALKLSRDASDGYSALRFSRIKFPVKKGEILNASVKFLNNARKANFHIYLQPGNKRLRTGSSVRSKWQTLKIENWTADKDYEEMDIRLWCDGKGDVFFDDLKVKSEKLAEEWTYNQSFEDSVFLKKCGMTNWGKGVAEAKLSNEFVRDGKNTLELSRKNPDGYSCLKLPPINLPIKKGKVVTVKVWCVNFCQRGSMHVELYPKRKRLRTGLSGMVEWGETLKVKFQADRDYNQLHIKLWVSGKGKVFFDKLQVTVGGKDTLNEEIVPPCKNKVSDLPAAVTAKEIILFRTPASQKVYPNYIPSRDELIDSPLKLSLAAGEERLLALGICSNKFTGNIDAGLKSFSGLKTKCYRPKMQKLRTEMKSSDYTVGPKILEPNKPLVLDKSKSGQFIFSFKADKNQPTGIKKGEIVLSSAGKVLAKLPIEVEVLPFKLVNPPVQRLMWAGWVFSKFGHNQKKLEACLRDMKDHGMTTVEGALIPHLRFKDDDVEVDCSNLKIRIASFHNVFDTKVMMIKGANNIGSAVCRSINPKWADNIPSRSINPGLKDSKRWKLFDKAYAVWTDFLIKADIEPYMYVYDEPGGHVWRNQAIETISHCKQVRPKAKIAITTTMEFAETMNKEINVNVFPYYAEFSPVKARRFCKDNNDIFWVYGQCWSNSPRSAEVLRYEAGFYAWAIRTQGIGWWCYMYPVEDPYNDFDGKSQDFMMTYMTAEGMVPTLNWEAIAEGINDMKYLYTLEAAIKKAGSTNSKAVQDAKKLLTEIKRNIPMKAVYILSPSSIKYILNAKQMDIWRSRIIKALKSLN
jgi:hypothetical protein